MTNSAASATSSASRVSTTPCCGMARCRSASIAGCCAARPAQPVRPDPGVQVIPAIDLEGGRSRIVYWPGAAAGVGAPTDRPDRIAERFVALGASAVHLVDFDGARSGAPANLEAVGSIAARIAVPLQLAGGVDSADAIRLAFAAGATRVVLTTAIADRPDELRARLAVAGDLLAVRLEPPAGRVGRLSLAPIPPPARSGP